MTDGPVGMNPVLAEAVKAVAVALGDAFDQVWSRPDAAELMELFLDDRLRFGVSRGGVEILRRDGV